MSFTATPMFPGDFQDSAARLAASVKPSEARHGNSASDPWQQMLALGWQAVLVPEESGGAGGTLAELASIIEATARHALTAPLIDRCAVAPSVLAAARTSSHARACLEAVAAGEASACPVLEGATPHLDAAGMLVGTLQGADLSEPASHLLLHARATDGTPVVLLLATAGLLQPANHYGGMDGRTTTDIVLDGVHCTPEDVILRGAAASAAVAQARELGTVLSCVQAIGAAGAMIEQTIDYLNTRSQFGVALASFQALRHRVVEMYVAYENGRGLVRQLVLAAGDATTDAEARAREVAMAKLYLDDAGRQIAEAAIQLHGGMGMSRETLAARIAVQSLTCGLRYGDSAQCLDLLAAHALAA